MFTRGAITVKSAGDLPALDLSQLGFNSLGTIKLASSLATLCPIGGGLSGISGGG